MWRALEGVADGQETAVWVRAVKEAMLVLMMKKEEKRRELRRQAFSYSAATLPSNPQKWPPQHADDHRLESSCCCEPAPSTSSARAQCEASARLVRGLPFLLNSLRAVLHYPSLIKMSKNKMKSFVQRRALYKDLFIYLTFTGLQRPSFFFFCNRHVHFPLSPPPCINYFKTEMLAMKQLSTDSVL